MTSENLFVDELKDNILRYLGSELNSDLSLCQNMLGEKSECCCAQLYTGYQTAHFPFYSEQAPYSSGLPPPGQFMSDMEGTYLYFLS